MDTTSPYTFQWTPSVGLPSQRLLVAVYAIDNAGNQSSFASNTYALINYHESINNTNVLENWVSNRAYLNQLALSPSPDAMCSMASIAMVRAQAGLIGGDFDSLKNEAVRAWNTEMRGPWVGQVSDYLNRNGMQASYHQDSKDNQWARIKTEINANRAVILNAPSESFGGRLTRKGHYIVIIGYKETITPHLRQIIVYDPFGEWLGSVSHYSPNNPTSNPDLGGAIGKFKYYDYDKLGRVFTVTARRSTNVDFTSIPSSPPDLLYVREDGQTVIYEGHGQVTKIFLPILINNFAVSK